MTANQQISTSGNDDWSLVAEVVRSRPGSNQQIPRFDLDVELTADFIAVEVTASNQRPTWASAGYLAQVYQFEAFELTSTQYFIALNQINLIRVNRPAPIAYRLVYDPLKYFVDATVKVWQYNGIQTDLLLQDIANTLQNITVSASVDFSDLDNKLDQILSNQQGNNYFDLSEINSKLDTLTELVKSLPCQGKSPSQSSTSQFFLFN